MLFSYSRRKLDCNSSSSNYVLLSKQWDDLFDIFNCYYSHMLAVSWTLGFFLSPATEVWLTCCRHKGSRWAFLCANRERCTTWRHTKTQRCSGWTYFSFVFNKPILISKGFITACYISTTYKETDIDQVVPCGTKITSKVNPVMNLL